MKSRVCLLIVLLIVSVTARTRADERAEPAALVARRVAREATAPELANDPAARVARFAEAVALMPEHPRYWLGLAAAQVAAGEHDAGVKTLERLVDLGNFVDLPALEPLAAVRERDDFRAVIARMTKLREPIGTGDVIFELFAMHGLIEGIAWREKTGECFFGDVHLRTIWRRTADGNVVRFGAADDRVLGVFGLEVDEAGRALWVAMSALPEMKGYTTEMKGRAGLAEFDLEGGALRRVVWVPTDDGEHVLGDLLVAEDGSIFATDSAASIVWRLSAGGEALERWAESAEFLSLQGLAWSADGSALVVAAYGNGLLRIDRASRAVTRLAAPMGTTLLGIDGLECAQDGSLVAVQNGIDPARVVHIAIDPAARAILAVTVLEAAQPALADPTLVCRSGADLLVVGDAGWRFFNGEKPGPAEPRSVPIVRLRAGR